jgi:hypothetical protein
MRIRRTGLITPERPKMRIRLSPITNGGVMIGNTDKKRSAFL